jgi:murein DD-endopeptidase MepM/ murein hydrolase activator NlpD
MHRITWVTVALLAAISITGPALAVPSLPSGSDAGSTQPSPWPPASASVSACQSPLVSPSPSPDSRSAVTQEGQDPKAALLDAAPCPSPSATPSPPSSPTSLAPASPSPASTAQPSVPDPSPSSTPSPTSPAPEPPLSAEPNTPTRLSPPIHAADKGPMFLPSLPPPSDPTDPGVTEPPSPIDPVRELLHPWTADRRWGTYGTSSLARAARRVSGAHPAFSRQRIVRQVFMPFPVGGLAWWSDSWGAPRYAGGYHPHHGQDILCNAGTPLLAVQRGMIRLSSDPLGGTTLELVRPDGSFWYYAHLESYAARISDESVVRAGTIIGICGSSGDATVPHLHFCKFSAAGVAQDPMGALVRWLHEAERRAGRKRSGPSRSPIDTTSIEETGSRQSDAAGRFVARGTQAQGAPAPTTRRSFSDPTLAIDAVLLAVTLLGMPVRRRFQRKHRRWHAPP